LFFDSPLAPLSIHNFTKIGESLGKPVGSWFGPSTISQVVKHLINTYNPCLNLRVFTAVSPSINNREVNSLCSPNLSCSTINCKWEHSLFLLIPTRIGANGVNPMYYSTLQEYMKLKQSAGLLGGKPNYAFYFVAVSGSKLYYLDPHVTQKLSTQIDSYFCTTAPKVMTMDSLDECLALGFYLKNYADWVAFQSDINNLNQKQGFHPLFSIDEHSEATQSYNGSLGEDFDMASSLSVSGFITSGLTNFSGSPETPAYCKTSLFTKRDKSIPLVARSSLGASNVLTDSSTLGFEVLLKEEASVSLNPNGEDFDI